MPRPRGPPCLYMEVDHLDSVLAAMKDARMVMPLRTAFYGMKEFAVQDPGGHFVTLPSPWPRHTNDANRNRKRLILGGFGRVYRCEQVYGRDRGPRLGAPSVSVGFFENPRKILSGFAPVSSARIEQHSDSL